MNYVGAVNLMINGVTTMVPVAKVAYQNRDEPRPAGGVVEESDGTLQIILDARLTEEAADVALEAAVAEVSRRLSARWLN
jgi:hypothetical protein